MSTPGKRIKILKDNAIAGIYKIPCFNQADRVEFFSLSTDQEKELEKLRSLKSKAMFVLQLGYFKARRMFFVFDLEEVQDDSDFVVRNIFHSEVNLSGTITKPTRLTQQRRILDLFNYRLCTGEDRSRLYKKACALAPIGANPSFIFEELVSFLEREQIVLPGYSILQNIIGKALVYESNRLESNLTKLLDPHEKERLADLLKAEETLYQLTLLKREPKDFSFKEMGQEKDRLELLRPSYELSVKVLSKLDLSNENITRYASLVGYYTVYKLKRLKQDTANLYLLCFVHLRYQKINDHLIDAFIYHANKYTTEQNW